MKPLQAKRQTIIPALIPQNQIDPDKVAHYASRMVAGEKFPPVVVAKYGDSYMPIDGHHRMSAAALLGERIDAYVVGGRAFENRDLYGDGRAENNILCDGIPALEVADYWSGK